MTNFKQNNVRLAPLLPRHDPSLVPEIISAGVLINPATTHHGQERQSSIEELKGQISELEVRDAELTKREAELSKQIAGVEAEIKRVSKLVRRFDKIDDFARMTHDLDVAEAAYNAFSRYCHERGLLEDQLEGLHEDYHFLENEIDDVFCKADELNSSLSEMDGP